MLLTGFESYGGRSLNPAEQVVKRLGGTEIRGVGVVGHTLPVDYRDIGPRIAQLIEEVRPRAVICFGLAAIWPWLAERVRVGGGDVDHHRDRTLLTLALLAANDPLAAPGDDRDLIGQEAGAGEAAAVVAWRVLEDTRISVAHSGRALAGDAAFVEQAEQPAAGGATLQQPGERRRDRLAHCHPADVAEDAVGEALELEPACDREPDERVLRAAEGVRKGPLCGGGGVPAISSCRNRVAPSLQAWLERRSRSLASSTVRA